jgi:hypothetical protein
VNAARRHECAETKAKDLQDVLRLQSSFAQKQMESYARQAQELGRLMVEATRSASSKKS